MGVATTPQRAPVTAAVADGGAHYRGGPARVVPGGEGGHARKRSAVSQIYGKPCNAYRALLRAATSGGSLTLGTPGVPRGALSAREPAVSKRADRWAWEPRSQRAPTECPPTPRARPRLRRNCGRGHVQRGTALVLCTTRSARQRRGEKKRVRGHRERERQRIDDIPSRWGMASFSYYNGFVSHLWPHSHPHRHDRGCFRLRSWANRPRPGPPAKADPHRSSERCSRAALNYARGHLNYLRPPLS